MSRKRVIFSKDILKQFLDFAEYNKSSFDSEMKKFRGPYGK